VRGYGLSFFSPLVKDYAKNLIYIGLAVLLVGLLALVEQVAHRPAARRYRCQSPRTQDLYPRNLDDLAEYGPEYPGLVFQKMKVRFTGGYRQSGQRGSMACGMNDNMYAFFLPIDHWHLYCLINSGVSR
jgi:hypothetical protein